MGKLINANKIDAGNISKVCSGKLKSAKKRFFKFKINKNG